MRPDSPFVADGGWRLRRTIAALPAPRRRQLSPLAIIVHADPRGGDYALVCRETSVARSVLLPNLEFYLSLPTPD